MFSSFYPFSPFFVISYCPLLPLSMPFGCEFRHSSLPFPVSTIFFVCSRHAGVSGRARWVIFSTHRRVKVARRALGAAVCYDGYRVILLGFSGYEFLGGRFGVILPGVWVFKAWCIGFLHFFVPFSWLFPVTVFGTMCLFLAPFGALWPCTAIFGATSRGCETRK